MFGTIRKHQTWLWVFLVIVMSAGLAIFFTPTAGTGGGGYSRGSSNYGSIDGRKISESEFMQANREAYLEYLVQHGQYPGRGASKSEFDEQRETYFRLLLLRKLQEYHIDVDDKSVAAAAAEIIRGFAGGKNVPFDLFVQKVLAPYAGPTEFEEFLRHELGIRQLVSVLGLSGTLVTPQEAQALYVRERQEYSADAVFFSGPDYLAAVRPAPTNTIENFYRTHEADYRIPDRVQVSYVFLNVTNALAAAQQKMGTNLDGAVEATMLQLGTNYTHFAPTAEGAKAVIRQDLIRRQAMTEVFDQANSLLDQVLNKQNPAAADLAAAAKQKGYSMGVTAPFDRESEGPPGVNGGPNFVSTAFLLTTNTPVADQPLRGDDGVYLIALDKLIPSRMPSLSEVRDRVVQDYRHSQAVALARAAGAKFDQTLTNGLAAGKSFGEICAESAVKPMVVPPFSISTRELPPVEQHMSLGQFKQIAYMTPIGKASAFYPTLEGGVVVYLRGRLPIDQARMKEELPAFIQAMRRERENEAFSMWFNRQAETSLRDTPLAQPQPSSLKAGS